MRDRLHVFSVVADKLNFTQAAQELFMSQPAVSSAIKALENEFGLPLFSRVGGRVELTEAGRILESYAVRIQKLEQEAVNEIRALSGSVQGRLTIGATTTIDQYILPKLIGEFAASYPDVSFVVVSQTMDPMAQLLLDGKVDVAVVEGEANSHQFHATTWMSDELFLNVADTPDAPEALTFEELLKQPLILREKGSGHRQAIEAAFRSRGVDLNSLNIVLELGSTEAVKLAVENGLGGAFLSDWSCKKERALHSMKAVPVHKFHMTRNFYILQTKESENNSLVQRFVGYLQRVASRQG